MEELNPWHGPVDGIGTWGSESASHRSSDREGDDDKVQAQEEKNPQLLGGSELLGESHEEDRNAGNHDVRQAIQQCHSDNHR